MGTSPHISQSVRLVVLRVHPHAFMIHPDHRDLEPLVPGTWRNAGSPCTDAPRPTTACRAWASKTPSSHRMLSLGHVATCCPCSSITSKYSGMGEFAQLVDLLQRIYAFMCGHFRHQPIAIARNALQRHAEHPVHLAVGLSGLKEANAAIVGVTDQPRKLVLSQLAPPDRSWSRCQRRAASP